MTARLRSNSALMLLAVLALQVVALAMALETTYAQASAVKDHAMCLNVDPSTERPLNRTYRFYMIESQAVSWFETEIREIGPAQISWYWQDPTGVTYRSITKSVTFASPGVWRFWDILPIRGYLDNRTGLWTVSVYHRAQLLYNESFVIDPSAYEIMVSVKGLGQSLTTRVTIDGKDQGSVTGGASKLYVLKSEATHNISVESTVYVGNGTRYLCRSNWKIVSSGALLHFYYELQFLLLVKSERGEVEPNVNGWYGNGTIVTFRVPNVVPGFPGAGYLFTSWRGGFTSDQPNALVVMSRPRTIDAVWVADYSLLFIFAMSVLGVCVIIVIVAVIRRHEARRIRF